MRAVQYSFKCPPPARTSGRTPVAQPCGWRDKDQGLIRGGGADHSCRYSYLCWFSESVNRERPAALARQGLGARVAGEWDDRGRPTSWWVLKGR